MYGSAPSCLTGTIISRILTKQIFMHLFGDSLFEQWGNLPFGVSDVDMDGDLVLVELGGWSQNVFSGVTISTGKVPE